MPKRPSNGSTSGRGAKKPKSDDGLPELTDAERDQISHLEWWPTVMNDLDEMMSKHTSLATFFVKEFPDLDSRKKLAQDLLEAFPVPDGVCLSTDLSPGIKNWAVWQGCFHVQAGNKGLLLAEYTRNLVQLVLVQGCRTDATRCAGVEFPVLQPLIATYFDQEWLCDDIIPGTYQCQSLGFTKGWSRAICFLTAAYLLQKHGLVEEYRDKMPSQFQSFCLLKGMVVETAGSEIDRIRANRGYFGLASASTLTSIYICRKVNYI